MHQIAILYPVFVLAMWTFCVLLLIPIVRFRASFAREVKPNDFKYGESVAVPDWVRLPNRNYMNLLELPVLFYVVCILAQIQGAVTPAMLVVAWSYVVLRVIHSIIHLTYNQVIHRLMAFAISNFVLLALWIMTALHVCNSVGAS